MGNLMGSKQDGLCLTGTDESCSLSAVAWPAIFAGSFAAVAVSLILLILGSGFGLSVMSPWSHEGASLTALTVTTIIWLIVMQWASAGIGGYLAGRLRNRWNRTNADEVFFRDTAHGFLSWCVASVFTAAVLTASVSSIIGSGTQAAATMASGNMHNSQQADNADGSNPLDYYIDSMYRKDNGAASTDTEKTRSESSIIVMKSLKDGEDMSENDRMYLVNTVSANTGLDQSASMKRVDETMAQINAAETKAKEMADKARKASAAFSIFTALSMLIGAFIACVTAALGGRCRDCV